MAVFRRSCSLNRLRSCREASDCWSSEPLIAHAPESIGDVADFKTGAAKLAVFSFVSRGLNYEYADIVAVLGMQAEFWEKIKTFNTGGHREHRESGPVDFSMGSIEILRSSVALEVFEWD